MPKNIRPDKIAEKQVNRATSTDAKDAYIDSMSNLTVNPAAEAAKKAAEWQAELEAIFASGAWKDIMGKIKKEDIVGPATEFGGDNLIDGVEKRSKKVDNFWNKWGPKLKAHMDTINAMPDKTEADKDKKVLANYKGLKKLKGAWR